MGFLAEGARSCIVWRLKSRLLVSTLPSVSCRWGKGHRVGGRRTVDILTRFHLLPSSRLVQYLHTAPAGACSVGFARDYAAAAGFTNKYYAIAFNSTVARIQKSIVDGFVVTSADINGMIGLCACEFKAIVVEEEEEEEEEVDGPDS